MTQYRDRIATYYVHMRAKDHAGNETYRCFGPYDIAHTAPVARDVSVTVREGEELYIKLDAEDNDYNDHIATWDVLTQPTGGEDPAFTFHASTVFEDGDSETVPVRVTQQNRDDTESA